MDLKQLQALGAIDTRPLVARKVTIRYPVPNDQTTWSDPEVPEYPESPEFVEAHLDTHIRKRSSADFLELINAPDQRKGSVAILRCVCQPDGTPVFETFEQADNLKEWVWLPLLAAVNEVNGFGPKNSRPRMSSGMKSPSSSAARLPKHKRASLKKSAPAGSPIAPSAAP